MAPTSSSNTITSSRFRVRTLSLHRDGGRVAIGCECDLLLGIEDCIVLVLPQNA